MNNFRKIMNLMESKTNFAAILQNKKITGIIGISNGLTSNSIIINLDPNLSVKYIPTVLSKVEAALEGFSIEDKKVVGGLYAGGNFQIELTLR